MTDEKKSGNALTSYLREVGIEFKKIVWPGRQELVDSTAVVLMFIVILAGIVLCIDKAIMLILDVVLK